MSGKARTVDDGVALDFAPWAEQGEKVLGYLESDRDGLAESEAGKRLQQYGPNQVSVAAKANPWILLVRQFRSLIVALLVAAAIVSAAVGDWVEAWAVLAVVVINALIGFFTEWRATRSMEALQRLTETLVRVRRQGRVEIMAAENLVPGDIVHLESGDLVPADLRVLTANLLQADESALTGESLPIRKTETPVPSETALAERKSMLFRGGRITDGTGIGIVTATGLTSEIGKISDLVSRAERKPTPLEKQLDRLGYRLIRVALGLTVLMALLGIVMGRDVTMMVQTAIALAVAAIPEGLPVVATIALARGLWRMADRNALINRLSAVETLGSTGVICTDKTGTLTENRMKVSTVWPSGAEHELTMSGSSTEDSSLCVVLETGCLCNNAQLGTEEGTSSGDPLEVALLEGARDVGIPLEELDTQEERLSEVPFDSVTRRMATVCKRDGRVHAAVKGAPEAILPLCRHLSEPEEVWGQRNEEMASRGLRVIALAGKEMADPREDPFEGLEFHGLVGMMDPPRKDVPAAVDQCRKAGVRVVMITGDQAATASAIAKEIGLEPHRVLAGAELEGLDPSIEADRGRILSTDVISRATPTQKFELVRLYQEEGEVVAMTGDGVNDAPALKQADIGIAMGLRGTDVARESAAMVLRDDAFPSIVAAIEQGRTIFSNIRKFVTYLISCNLSEIFVVGLAMLFVAKLPILPLQILFLNLVTDVFPALALGVTPAHGNVLSRPPRKKGEAVLRRDDWFRIVRQAVVIAVATLGAYWVALSILGKEAEEAVTVSFLTLAIAQLAHVFNMADWEEPYFRSVIVRNPMIWIAHILCLTLLAVACFHPLLAEVLTLRPPSPIELGVVFAFSSLPVVVGLLARKWDRE